MRKKYLLIIFLLSCLCYRGNAILPDFFGARSLSLGFASVGFNYDVNAIFINPALLGDFPGSITSYQSQISSRSRGHFLKTLEAIQNKNLNNFATFSKADKETVISELKNIYSMKNGFYGFDSHIPGLLLGNYAFSISVFNTAVMNTVDTDILNKSVDSISSEDISSLMFNFIGLKYKSYSVAYALELSNGFRLGISLHYLNGEISNFNESILDKSFPKSTDIWTYLDHGLNQVKYSFRKVNLDLGLSIELGKYFKAGLVARNFNSPELFKDNNREIVLKRRVIAGLSFRPGMNWGIYLDMDIYKTDLYFSGKEVQPISLGVEKGFFQNKLMLRMGLGNDLTMRYLMGEQSDIFFGFGLGFDMGNIILDLGGGIDNSGSIVGLAISGFLIVK